MLTSEYLYATADPKEDAREKVDCAWKTPFKDVSERARLQWMLLRYEGRRSKKRRGRW